jgi:mannose-6-phosphate isomerase-like protein (cupin superfamily)
MHVVEATGGWRGVLAPTYVEKLRTAHLSVGTYLIPRGAIDEQQPHTEDEVYVVVRGRARLWTSERAVEVEPGSVVFVPAGEDHRFLDAREDLEVLVIFGPAEHSLKSSVDSGGAHR